MLSMTLAESENKVTEVGEDGRRVGWCKASKWKCSIKHVWDCTIEQSLHFTSSCIRVTGGVLLAQSTIISWFLLGGKDSERLLIIFQPEGHFFLKWVLIWSLSCSSQIYMNLFHCDTWLRTTLRLLLY